MWSASAVNGWTNIAVCYAYQRCATIPARPLLRHSALIQPRNLATKSETANGGCERQVELGGWRGGVAIVAIAWCYMTSCSHTTSMILLLFYSLPLTDAQVLLYYWYCTSAGK